jgi:hypothetical protein
MNCYDKESRLSKQHYGKEMKKDEAVLQLLSRMSAQQLQLKYALFSHQLYICLYTPLCETEM